MKNILRTYNRDTDRVGYFIEASTHVPLELHDVLDFAPVAKQNIDPRNLSVRTGKIGKHQCSSGGARKVFPYLGRQTKMYHIVELQFWFKKGVEITEVHSLFSFNQAPFLKAFMEEQASVRAKLKGKDDVQAEVVKLGINSTFGKFSQNMKKQQSMQCFARFDSFEIAAGKSNVENYWEIFNGAWKDKNYVEKHGHTDDFFGMVLSKQTGGKLLNSPRAVGFTIL